MTPCAVSQLWELSERRGIVLTHGSSAMGIFICESRTVRNSLRGTLLTLLAFVGTASGALPYSMQVSEVEMNEQGLIAGQAAVFIVRGVVTPAIPCSYQALLIYSTDPFQKEVVAMMIAAKTSGQRITFNHVLCTAGFSRSNAYALQ